MAADPVYVFDSNAIIALLQGELGADEVSALLEKKSRQQRFLLHAVQVCEIFYDSLRRGAEDDGTNLESMLLASGFEIDLTIPSSLWRTAGRLKASLKRISLADCFALALTLHEGGTLVTSDHHELDAVQSAGICPIRFIR